MNVNDDLWDELNATFRSKRQTLLNQLKELDVWYEEQFVLLAGVSPSTERR